MLTEFEAEGWTAFQRGETRNLNPYDRSSKQGQDWDHGWRLAYDRWAATEVPGHPIQDQADLPELDRLLSI